MVDPVRAGQSQLRGLKIREPLEPQTPQAGMPVFIDMWKKITAISFCTIGLLLQSVFATTDEKEIEGAVHYLLNPTWNPGAVYFDGTGEPPKFLLIEAQKKELKEAFWGVKTVEEVLKASDTLNSKKKILISTATPKAYAGAHWKLLDDLKKLCKVEGYALYVAYGK